MKIICQNYSQETITQREVVDNMHPAAAEWIVKQLNENPKKDNLDQFLIVADDYQINPDPRIRKFLNEPYSDILPADESP